MAIWKYLGVVCWINLWITLTLAYLVDDVLGPTASARVKRFRVCGSKIDVDNKIECRVGETHLTSARGLHPPYGAVHPAGSLR